MALTKCDECGDKVSTSASACPHCGATPDNFISLEDGNPSKEEVVEDDAEKGVCDFFEKDPVSQSSVISTSVIFFVVIAILSLGLYENAVGSDYIIEKVFLGFNIAIHNFVLWYEWGVGKFL